MDQKINTLKFLSKIILISFIIINIYSKENKDYKELPYKIKVAFLVRILEFNNTISESNEDISIHVINDPFMHQELNKLVGLKINEKEIKQVTLSNNDDLPSYNPSIIYIGNATNIESILSFTQSNKILSITGNPKLINNGITISIVMLFGTPNILLETKSSQKESMKWDAKMMKISTLIK